MHVSAAARPCFGLRCAIFAASVWLTDAGTFDCTLQKPEDWDASKRRFCCENPPFYCEPFNRGCDAPCLYSDVTLSCQARMTFRQRVSYAKKKDGCIQAYWDVVDQCPTCHSCTAEAAGCGSKQMDCAGDPETDKWDTSTREFCCLKKGKACPNLAVEPDKAKLVLYDCEDHIWDWSSAWTAEQKTWCCNNKKKGCEGMSESRAPESKAHIPDADFKIVLRAQTQLEKQGLDWESVLEPTITPQPATTSPQVPEVAGKITTTSKPFSCGVDLSNFAATWSKAKKTWCCRNEQKGCMDSAPAVQMDYNCDDEVTTWSRAKKDWCCTHKVVGCDSSQDNANEIVENPPQSEHSTRSGEGYQAQPREQDLEGQYNQFDCTVELDNWQFAWADEQKEACCQTVGVGCKSDEIDYPVPSEADFFFDCSKGHSTEWSPKKREVCCSTSNANCDFQYG
mmetsp:Transcript_12965/g.30808  ORF Transcript_12965/g.30808 Transcript_12965/m.30808 type:complete len:451 (+) Transcript_12965:63-1415(+)